MVVICTMFIKIYYIFVKMFASGHCLQTRSYCFFRQSILSIIIIMHVQIHMFRYP